MWKLCLLVFLVGACTGFECVGVPWEPSPDMRAAHESTNGSSMNGGSTNGGHTGSPGRENNGFGNGDQDPPGRSASNNNAENDPGGRSDPSHGGRGQGKR